MGLFDRIDVMGATPFACPHGHEIREDIQTQDIEPDSYERYLMFDGQLYSRGRQIEPTAPAKIDDLGLVVETVYPRALLTVNFRAYSFCRKCDPIFFRSKSGQLTESILWCEWDVVARDGRLLSVTTTENHLSRDAKREELLNEGHHPLKDDDRVALGALREFRRNNPK